MLERYSPEAKRVVFFARYEAGRDGALAIETQHLLLGIQRVDRRLAKQFLTHHPELEPEKKSFWQRLFDSRPSISTSVPLMPSPAVKCTLLYADEAVRHDATLKVTPEILLTALLRQHHQHD